MEIGQNIKVVLMDETVVTGTIVAIGHDSIVLDNTNVHNDWVFIQEDNIKKLTVPIK